jgi:hypothetical protein
MPNDTNKKPSFMRRFIPKAWVVLQFLFNSALGLGLTLTTIITLVLVGLTDIVKWVQHPYVYCTAAIFLFLWWTYIGIVILKNQNIIRTVRVVRNYAHTLITDPGWTAGVAKYPPNHLEHANKDALQLFCQFRNVHNEPLRVRIEDIRVVLDGRSCDDFASKRDDVIISPFGTKNINCGAVVWDVQKRHLLGTTSIKLIYGPVEGNFERIFILRNKIQIMINPENAPPGAAQSSLLAELVEEKDQPYAGQQN